MSTDAPLVSVIMANYNGAAHVAAAIRSVLRQTLTSLELVFSDDGSGDDSIARALAAANGDPRFVLLESVHKGSGPAAARNRALQAARGEWIAIVDSDDFIHPERLEKLIDAAKQDGADIVADDLVVFRQDRSARPQAYLRGAMAKHPQWISAAQYADANRLLAMGPSFGYLKPIFRRAGADGALRAYDESLRIAEDFDLIMRMLIGGARMRVYPQLGYFYRKHASSISHRLRCADITAMLAGHDRLGVGAALDPGLKDALDRRRASLVTASAFDDLINQLKAKRFGAALAILAKRPATLPLLRNPLFGRLSRRPAPPASAEGQPRIALLSRQRIVGSTNGSSSYVLAIARAARDAGFAIDYIGASPKIFGRWPWLRPLPETEVFSSYSVRGGVRAGPFIFARDPRVALTAALGVFEKALAKLKLPTPGWSKPAAFAVGARAERADMLYVARSIRPNTRAILCDYAFLAPIAPYALCPETPVFTIMHDLMSARVADPYETVPAEVAALTPKAEFEMLGQSDVVLAIQAAEAKRVREELPKVKTLVAPHFVASVEVPQSGEDDALLFVGSNTAPNVTGLEWFFEACWPRIRAVRPKAILSVVGSVSRSLSSAPTGVSILGFAPDLEPHYASAGVVISPLRTGSGLKIKLIEAMAKGKAMVGTSVTTQGVEDVVSGSIVVEDDPDAFAEAIITLLGAPTRRQALAQAALDCAKTNFSEAACFAGFTAALREGGSNNATDEIFSSTPHSLGKQGHAQHESV